MRAVVIGAGVVGLAVARSLSARGAEVWVLERHAQVGTETSSRNSEVVHAGLYYPAGSAKARLCVEGRERLAGLIDAGEVRGRWTGKVVVAADDGDLPALLGLYDRASANGAQGLRLLTGLELTRRVPGVRGTAALLSAGTGIVDAHGLMGWLRRQSQGLGATLLTRHCLLSAQRGAAGWRLRVGQPDGSAVELDCDLAVNCAGLLADRVAHLAVEGHDLPRQHLIKGSYFEVTGPPLADTLVYPVPSPELMGLGTHLTVDLAGRCRLGPDVQKAVGTEDLAVDPQRAALFHRAAQHLFPNLTVERLRPAYAGIRPKLDAQEFRDFYIREEAQRGAPGWVNLLGIESPGLTASLAIGEEVTRLIGLA